MDAMTQRLWDAEFEKQYPKPEGEDDVVEKALESLREEINRKWTFFNRVGRLVAASERFHESIKTPWRTRRAECLARFKAIYKAQPLQALEALRNGNLLID